MDPDDYFESLFSNNTLNPETPIIMLQYDGFTGMYGFRS